MRFEKYDRDTEHVSSDPQYSCIVELISRIIMDHPLYNTHGKIN